MKCLQGYGVSLIFKREYFGGIYVYVLVMDVSVTFCCMLFSNRLFMMESIWSWIIRAGEKPLSVRYVRYENIRCAWWKITEKVTGLFIFGDFVHSSHFLEGGICTRATLRSQLFVRSSLDNELISAWRCRCCRFNDSSVIHHAATRHRSSPFHFSWCYCCNATPSFQPPITPSLGLIFICHRT